MRVWLERKSGHSWPCFDSQFSQNRLSSGREGFGVLEKGEVTALAEESASPVREKKFLLITPRMGPF